MGTPGADARKEGRCVPDLALHAGDCGWIQLRPEGRLAAVDSGSERG